MVLRVQNLGKRFNRHWIFRRINYEFNLGSAYAITGANGSGKSTFLQVLAGAMQQSEGNIFWQKKGEVQTNEIGGRLETNDKLYKVLAIAAPYLEVIEELTLKEFLTFHFQFKTIFPGCTIEQIINYISLKESSNKQIRYYSSGMKQRVKLAQAFFSDTPVILLDEPTTNLDTVGIELYHRLIQNFCSKRLLIICSNDENEISGCGHRINMADFK